MTHPIIAVDFDGCLCVNKYPDIGAPNHKAIAALRARRRDGAKLILWTCRVGDELEAALNFCWLHGLRFDAVNTNLPEVIEKYGGDTRKICADEYWDDRAVVVRMEERA
jgi:hypothetical protein